jgi:hypothetical protein
LLSPPFEKAASCRHTAATAVAGGTGGTGTPDGGFWAHSSHKPCAYPDDGFGVFVPSNLRATFDASTLFAVCTAHVLYGLELKTFDRAARPASLTTATVPSTRR